MNKDMINKRLQIIADLQAELNKIKNHYDETLENDPKYQKVQEEISKVKEESREKQDRILATTAYKAIADEMKTKRQELKEHKEALSQELVDYYRENGIPEIEDQDGNIKRMKFSVKLVS